jgi:hypothetical protein
VAQTVIIHKYKVIQINNNRTEQNKTGPVTHRLLLLLSLSSGASSVRDSGPDSKREASLIIFISACIQKGNEM